MAGIVLEGEGVTDEARAERSRAIAAEQRARSIKRMAEVKARVGNAKLGRALQFPGTALSDRVLAPGPYSRVVRAGDHLRIIHQPGGTTPAEFALMVAGLESAQSQAETLGKQLRGLTAGARQVG